jgi:hypothetical protein
VHPTTLWASTNMSMFFTRITAVPPKNMILFPYTTLQHLITYFRATTNHIATTDNIELSVKPWSCPPGLELHPSIDASSYPPGCYPQSNEILLNKGMKYWDSAFKCTRLQNKVMKFY